MRSRFLNVDYFRRPPRDSDELEFLSLSVPDSFPSDQIFEGEFCYTDLVLTIPADLHALSFENVLSRFISVVIPQAYDDRLEARGFLLNQNENRGFAAQEDGKYKAGDIESVRKEVQPEDKNELTGSVEKSRIFKEHLFERPEMSSPMTMKLIMENPIEDFDFISSLLVGYSFLDESEDIFENISEAANLYLKDLVGPLDFVDGMNPKHHGDKRSFFSEAVGYVQSEKQLILGKISLFEACVIGVDLSSSYSMEEAFQFLVTDVKESGLELDFSEFQSSFKGFSLDSFPGCVLYPHLLDLELQASCVKTQAQMESGICLLLKTLDHCYLPLVHMVVFDEVEVLDASCVQPLTLFDGSIVATDHEFWEPRLAELSSIGSFYEAIVSPELALSDDMFMSLPVPLLEDKDVMSLSEIVEGIFFDIKLYFSSASDQIYLDWHFSQENQCTRSACCACRNKLENVTSCEMPCATRCLKDNRDINLILFDDSLSNLSILHHLQETPETIPNQMSRKEGIGMPPCVEITTKNNSEKVSVFLESMSLSSDLELFMNARKGTVTTSYQDGLLNKTAEESTAMVLPSTNFNKSCCFPSVSVHEWNVEAYFIDLSDVILNIVNNIYGSYISMLQNEKKLQSSCDTGDADVHRFSKKRLMDVLTCLTESALACEDEGVTLLIVLYILKQMAYHVCFSGIHACCFYMRKMFHEFGCLAVRLSGLKSLVEDAFHKAEKDVVEFHPALPVIEGILRTYVSQSGKILIVAERAFWWPLTRKLTAQRISFQELRFESSCSYQEGVLEQINEVKASIATCQSDCLIITNEHLSSFFPFNMFSIVLEYGGYCGSSRVSTIFLEAAGMYHVHFLKIKLEELDVSKVLYEGFNIFQHLELSMEEIYQPLSWMQYLNNHELVNLLNFDPILEEDYKLSNVEPDAKVGPGIMLQTNPSVLLSGSGSPSFPSLIVIANTQKFNHKLLVSRRSSYQRILSMEKGGIQVVEREMRFPVDLILNASTCILWFDAERFMMSSPEEASACMLLSTESIATNLLMSLSFCFSDCILIFEGETSFLSAVMESSDGFHAAAGSLDMHLQLFFSGSSDLTDKIVLSCIKHASKVNKCLYPAMFESETLVESFLTSFSSMNPLSAHAVLSCAARVSDFFEWPYEKRLQAVQKYHVPDESILLFSALCRFGELGESKSGVTDCSSTVSSVLDSDSSYIKMKSTSKKQNCSADVHVSDIPIDEYLHFVPERISKSTLKPSRKSSLHPVKVHFNSQDLSSFPSSEIEQSNLQLKPGAYETEQLGWSDIYEADNFHEGVKEEVMDFKLPILKQNFPFSPENKASTWESHGIRKGTSATCIGGCSRSFGPSRHPSSVTANSNIDLDIWTSLLDLKCSSDEKIFEPNPDAQMDGFGRKNQEDILQESIMRQKYRRHTINMPFQEEAISPHYVDNPYLKASDMQHGSPWTVEFLKRIKEKTKMNNKFPHSISKNCSGKSPSIKRSLKRKSPSILDSYRYQGSSSKPKNTSNQKWHKLLKPALDLVKEQKPVDRLVPSWTPMDKRARRSLSFMKSRDEKQSKLVWNEQGVQCLRKRYHEGT